MNKKGITKYRDIIIGAGVSGLSYANFANHDDYLIFEKEDEIGGYCKTIKRSGYIWDYSGHFFHFRDKFFKNYIMEGINQNNILKIKKNSQIKYKNKYIDFPFQKNIHQLNKDELLECLYDFYFRKKASYSTFKEMLYSKLGRAISEKFLIPYNEKIYACDLNELDYRAMDRFFPEVTLESIIRNFKIPDNESYNSYFTYTKGGAIEYINSLAKRIPSNKIKLNEKIIEIDIENKIVKTTKDNYGFENIISSMPFVQLMDFCKLPYEKNIYSWNKVLVFNLGFDKKGLDLSNHWVYFPGKEFVFYRVGYYDNILADDRMSLYVEIGFSKDSKIDIDVYFNKVIKDLKNAKIIINQKLVDYHSVVMNPAYVHINKKSMLDVQKRMLELNNMNIYSIGRYGGWKYCSIEDNIIEAKNLADLIKS